MAITVVSGPVGGGGPYSTLAAWAADLATASLSANHVAEVSGTITDTGRVNVGGWTPNGFTVTLRAASGEGISAGGAARFLSSGRATLTNSVGYDVAYGFGGGVIVQDVQLRSTNGTAAALMQITGGSFIERVIGTIASSTGKAVTSSTGAGTVKSSLFFTSGGNGTDETDTLSTLNLLRCTFIGNGSGIGIASRYGFQRAQGCIVYGYATDFGGQSGVAAANSSHNATDKTSFGGTGWGTSGQVSLASSDFVSTTSGSEDYKAASGSTKLKDTGTAITGVTVDLFNVALPQNGTNDIGATEVAASVSNTTITPSVGSLALTGNAPTVTRSGSITVTPSAGSLALTGVAPTVLRGSNTTITPTAGALSLTGQAPTLTYTLESPPAGTLTLTGAAPTVVVSQVRQASAGSLALTGLAPTVIRGTIVRPTVGSLSLTGAAPTVSIGSGSGTVTPSVGALTLTGTAPTVIRGTIIQPGSGSLALTGQNATIPQAGVIVPASGSLSLSGAAPTVLRADRIVPSAGSLVISAAAPTVTQATTITPASGALSLSGAAPAVRRADTITPAAGALSITGNAPGVSANGNVTIQPGSAALLLSGLAPTATRSDSAIIQPASGSLSVTGAAPSVGRNTTIQPAAGSLAISGAAPSVTQQVGFVINPLTGALALVGSAPTVTRTDSMVITPGSGSLTLTSTLDNVGTVEGDEDVTWHAPYRNRVANPTNQALVLRRLN